MFVNDNLLVQAQCGGIGNAALFTGHEVCAVSGLSLAAKLIERDC